MRDHVFISYSRKDAKFMEELREHLKPYVRSGAVTVWSDQEIAAGSKWFDQIQEALVKTSVAVMLVSPSFLASDFIHDHELGPLLKQAEAGGVTILWVLLSASSYEETSLKDYQAVVSPPEKPLTQMKRADRDEAWVQVCRKIKEAVGPSVVELRLDKQSIPFNLRNFVKALQNLDFGDHPTLPETQRTSKLLPVPLIDKVLNGSEFPPEVLDPLLEGEQLAAAQKKLAEWLAQNKRDASAGKERLLELQARERELIARIERLERERPRTPSEPSGLALMQITMELHPYTLEEDRRQLDKVRREVLSTEFSLTQLQRYGEIEQSHLKEEVLAARAKDIVNLLRQMRDRALRLVEESATIGDGFLLLLSIALVIPAVRRHLTGHTEEAAWADRIAELASGKAESAVSREAQAVARDGFALAVTMQKRMEEGERATAEVRQILNSVPAEALHLLVAEQQKLLRFESPMVLSFKDLYDPADIAKAAARVERLKEDLGGVLDAVRMMMVTEASALHSLAEEANRRAEELRQRWSQEVRLLLPRLDDCSRIWRLLARAEESPVLGKGVREFCTYLRAEVERCLGEPPEPLLVRCESREFCLPEVNKVCAEHQVRKFLTEAENLRRRVPDFETQAAKLDRARRELAEQPRRRAAEYRRGLQLAVRWTALPWLGLVRGAILVRRFAPVLRSQHRDCRSLPLWTLPWLRRAALISALGTISFGCTISPVLTGWNPLWAAMFAFAALGYLLGFGLWTVETVRVALLVYRSRPPTPTLRRESTRPKRPSQQEIDELFAEAHARTLGGKRPSESRTRGEETRAEDA